MRARLSLILRAYPAVTGTFINVGTVLVGTLIGTLVGSRLPEGLQQRVMAGLGLVTLVIGVDAALAWNETNPLYVLGGVLLGGLVGEAIGIERWLERLGDRIQRALAGEGTHVSEGFVDGVAAVLRRARSPCSARSRTGSPTSTPSWRPSPCSTASPRSRSPPRSGWGVGLAAITVLVVQGGLTLGAGAFDDMLTGETLDALTSAGGILSSGSR